MNQEIYSLNLHATFYTQIKINKIKIVSPLKGMVNQNTKTKSSKGA